MRRVIPAIALAALSLAACSEETQDNAQETVESAAADTAANAQKVLDQGAEAAGNAAQDLAAKADETAKDADVVTPEEAAGQ